MQITITLDGKSPAECQAQLVELAKLFDTGTMTAPSKPAPGPVVENPPAAEAKPEPKKAKTKGKRGRPKKDAAEKAGATTADEFAAEPVAEKPVTRDEMVKAIRQLSGRTSPETAQKLVAEMVGKPSLAAIPENMCGEVKAAAENYGS